MWDLRRLTLAVGFCRRPWVRLAALLRRPLPKVPSPDCARVVTGVGLCAVGLKGGGRVYRARAVDVAVDCGATASTGGTDGERG